MIDSEAAQCVEILVGLLVFALGLPMVLLPLAIDDRVRQLAHKYRIWRPTVSLMIFIILTVLFILVGETVLVPELRRLGDIQVAGERIRHIYLFLTLLCAILVAFQWMRMVRSDVRLQIMENIYRTCLADYWQRRILCKDLVDDLLSLGELGSPGPQKQEVLKRVRDLIETVAVEISEREPDAKVDGAADLRDLMAGLEQIVGSNAYPGNEHNFRHCAVTLSRAWRALEARPYADGSHADGPYGVAVVQALGSLSLIAMRRYPRATTDLFLRAFPAHSGLYLALGREALREGRFSVAVASVSQLEAVVVTALRDGNGGAALRYDLAGLAALMWREVPLRVRAEASLTLLAATEEELGSVLEAAHFYHLEGADLDTVQSLVLVLERLRRRVPRQPRRNDHRRRAVAVASRGELRRSALRYPLRAGILPLSAR